MLITRKNPKPDVKLSAKDFAPLRNLLYCPGSGQELQFACKFHSGFWDGHGLVSRIGDVWALTTVPIF
jgi:hypothetical protein